MKVHKIDHVGIVVNDLSAAKAFFLDFGFEVEGEGELKEEWVGRVIGLDNVKNAFVMLKTPDGQANIELIKFYAPLDERNTPIPFANTLGIRHIAFVVEEVEAIVAKLKNKGTEVIGEITNYQDTYKLCYVRGPEGIILELAEQLKKRPSSFDRAAVTGCPRRKLEMENPVKPNPALDSLNKLLGTWKASDPSGAEGISGEVTFERMENNFFFIQHIDFGNGKSFEVIGYDEASNSLKTHYFSNTGRILEYTYEINDDTITVSIDMPHAKGKFSKDGNSFTGRWDWIEDGAKKGYDATMTRVQPKKTAA